MAVRVLYFAAVREVVGCASEEVALADLGEVADVEALWGWLARRYPQAERWRGHVRLAINQDFVADPARVLVEGDEVALIPPVSGGSGSTTHRSEDGRFVVTRAVLEPRAVEALVRREDAGAVVTFSGTVRDHTGDHAVSYLEYEAYEAMALAKLEETAAEAQADWPGAKVAIHHRHGRLELGEVAVVVCVTCPHRAEAFAACQFVIDRLKQVVPIWKKEVAPNGETWVGWGP